MSFIESCRRLYEKGITPLSIEKFNDDDFLFMKKYALDYFKNGKTDIFIDYMQEPRYFVQLWVAHLILDYAQANAEVNQRCIAEIKKYSKSPLTPEVAKEEMLWLVKNGYS